MGFTAHNRGVLPVLKVALKLAKKFHQEQGTHSSYVNMPGTQITGQTRPFKKRKTPRSQIGVSSEGLIRVGLGSWSVSSIGAVRVLLSYGKDIMESSALADPPVTALLKPGFTALSNGLIDSGLLAQLTRIELALFLVLCRFSTGFLRLQASIGEQKLLELTGASQTSLYEAKKALVQKGLITVSHTRTGRCLYQLVKALQPILTKGEAAEPPGKATWSKPPRLEVANPSAQPESYKEFKEIQDQHIAQPQPKHTDDDLLQSEIRHLDSRRSGKPVDTSLGLLVSRLRHLGVNEFMAHKLAKNAPGEVVEKALERVKTIQVTNPAGYLVSEISRGGYQEKPDPNKAQREFHREIHVKRQKERELTEQANQAAQARAEQLMEGYRELPASRQVELTEQVRRQANLEGFTKLPGWSEEHPAWRGLLIETLSKILISSS